MLLYIILLYNLESYYQKLSKNIMQCGARTCQSWL